MAFNPGRIPEEFMRDRKTFASLFSTRLQRFCQSLHSGSFAAEAYRRRPASMNGGAPRRCFFFGWRESRKALLICGYGGSEFAGTRLVCGLRAMQTWFAFSTTMLLAFSIRCAHIRYRGGGLLICLFFFARLRACQSALLHECSSSSLLNPKEAEWTHGS